MVDLDINGLYFARKPSTKALEMAINILDLKKEEVIHIGDQVFTDVLAANRFGIKSILVKPLSILEGPGTMLKRPFEKIVLKKAKEEKKDAN